MSLGFLSNWDPDLIIKDARTWNLASDTELLQQLNEFSTGLLSAIEKIDNSLNETIGNTETASIMVKNSCCKLLLLSNHQFVENRVYEDDDALPALNNKTNEAGNTKQEILLENVKQSIKYGLDMLESNYCHRTSSLYNNGTLDLESKNPYKGRSLPLIIGTDQFYISSSVETPTFDSYQLSEDPACLSNSFHQEIKEHSNTKPSSYPNEHLEENINVTSSKTNLDDGGGDAHGVTPSSDSFGEDAISNASLPKLIHSDHSKPASTDSASLYSDDKTEGLDIMGNASESEDEIVTTISTKSIAKTKAKELLFDIHNSDLFKSKINIEESSRPDANPSLTSSLFSDDSDVDDIFSPSQNVKPARPVHSSKSEKSIIPPAVLPKMVAPKQDAVTSMVNEDMKKRLVSNDDPILKSDLFDELERVDPPKDRKTTSSILHDKEKPFALFLDSSDEDEELFKPSKAYVGPSASRGNPVKGLSTKTSFVDLFEDCDDLFGKPPQKTNLFSQNFTDVKVNTSSQTSQPREPETKSFGNTIIVNQDSEGNDPLASDLMLKKDDLFHDDSDITNIFSNEQQPVQPLGLLGQESKTSVFLPNKFQDIFGSSDDENPTSPERYSTEGTHSGHNLMVNKSKSLQKVDASNQDSQKWSPKKDRLVGVISGGYKGSSDEDDLEDFGEPNVNEPLLTQCTEDSGDLFSAVNDQDLPSIGNTTLPQVPVLSPLHDLISGSSIPDIVSNPNERDDKPSKSSSQQDLSEDINMKKDFVSDLKGALGKKFVQIDIMNSKKNFEEPIEHTVSGIETSEDSLFDCPPKLPTLNSLSKHRPKRKKHHQPSKNSGKLAEEKVHANPKDDYPHLPNIDTPRMDATQVKDILSTSTEEEDLFSMLANDVKSHPENPPLPNLFEESDNPSTSNRNLVSQAKHSEGISLFTAQEDEEDDFDLFKPPPLPLNVPLARDRLASIFSDSDDDIEDIFSK